MSIEEKLELLPELLTLVELSKETTSEEVSEQADLGVSEDKDMLDFVACRRQDVCPCCMYIISLPVLK